MARTVEPMPVAPHPTDLALGVLATIADNLIAAFESDADPTMQEAYVEEARHLLGKVDLMALQRASGLFAHHPTGEEAPLAPES